MAIILAFAVTLLVTAGVLVRLRARAGTVTHAALRPDGFQEATVTINGRYRPDVVELIQGVPTRLHFLRREDDPCSEQVIFAHLGVERRLPAFQDTTVEFLPITTGTFLFTCRWGMYRGKLIVSPRREPLSVRDRVLQTPLLMTLVLWLPTAPLILLIVPWLVGWQATWYAVGVALVGELAACWAIYRFAEARRTPVAGLERRHGEGRHV